MAVKIKEIWMTEKTNELQTINTAWQIAIQEILRMVVRDIYRTDDETVFKSHIKRIEEAAVETKACLRDLARGEARRSFSSPSRISHWRAIG
jgi:hypothetical protein